MRSQAPGTGRPEPPPFVALQAGDGEALRVRGIVQGVGFRPTVWRLAAACGLAGDVRNDADGVLIRLCGDRASRQRFLRQLRQQVPPLARIDSIERAALPPDMPRVTAFTIVGSAAGAPRTGIAADAATCADCLADIVNPRNRRYRYPFTNCTHCGPRLSIIRAVPYDRVNTSMRSFNMCPDCQREYDDPADRRFHAQPNACPKCGPQLRLEDGAGRSLPGEPLRETCGRLRAGHIVAIKGIGGFHLAVDASNEAAVARLRERKRRYGKPFALMAKDVATIRRYCSVNAAEQRLLESGAAPIVLLAASGDAALPAGVAPGHRDYGFMLPYSPLHYLLLRDLDVPVVLTSGNRSDEPQCTGNSEARDRLRGIADAYLLHDRDIVNRVDDSVVRQVAGRPLVLRRARGYAPQTLRLPRGFEGAPAVLACGGELKNTFCLLQDGEALLSQHAGDLENPAAHAAWLDTLSLFEALIDHRPAVIAVDDHPDYLPAKFGRERAAVEHLPLVSVQHHHAHIAACLGDNRVASDEPPVLGLALDGIGFGDDGSFWGGEFLLADYLDARRLASLAAVPMPGGSRAIVEPWRMAWSHLAAALPGEDLLARCHGLPIGRLLADKPLATLAGMVQQGFNSPLTSSCGRLFDAVAAACGLRTTVSYEGQAAMEFEAAVDETALDDGNGYPFAVREVGRRLLLDPQPLWNAVLGDLRRGAATGVIAARFHAGLTLALAGMVARLTALHGDLWHGRVALSGGVFQNALLTSLLVERLESGGFTVLWHRQLPPNDGALSFGQALVAAARCLRAELEEERGLCA